MNIFKRVTVLVAALIITSSISFAAGVVRQDITALADGQYMLEMACTANTAGVVSATETDEAIDGLVYLVETVPDATTAPTNLYDLTLTTRDGLDIMGGNLANRSSTVVQRAQPLNYQAQSVLGKLTLNVSNNSANKGKFKVRIFYFR